MITIKISDEIVGGFANHVHRCGWNFKQNKRGIPDRIVDAKTGVLVAFNNTHHDVELEFGFLDDARKFMINLEVIK